MVAFSSARRAVQCSVEIQRAFEEHNLARPDEVVLLTEAIAMYREIGMPRHLPDRGNDAGRRWRLTLPDL